MPASPAARLDQEQLASLGGDSSAQASQMIEDLGREIGLSAEQMGQLGSHRSCSKTPPTLSEDSAPSARLAAPKGPGRASAPRSTA